MVPVQSRPANESTESLNWSVISGEFPEKVLLSQDLSFIDKECSTTSLMSDTNTQVLYRV